MYIRKTVRRYKDKTYVNFLLVESVLTDKGPRQKVICSLVDLSPRPPEQWLALARKLQDALTGQSGMAGMVSWRGWCQTLFLVLTCWPRNQKQSLTPHSIAHTRLHSAQA